MIAKWVVYRSSNNPVLKEYSHETKHFYMGGGVGASRRRDAKVSLYERYFDTRKEADEFIRDRELAKDRGREIDRIKSCAVDLLSALEAVVAVADRDTEEFNTARAIIAKAKGIPQ